MEAEGVEGVLGPMSLERITQTTLLGAEEQSSLDRHLQMDGIDQIT